MLVRREVERAAARSNPAVEAPPDEGVSRNASEPDSASLRIQGAAILPKMVKPTPTVKQRASAAVGLSGVVGDGGHRQINRGTWETRSEDGSAINFRRESITAGRFVRESEGLIVVRTPGNAGRAKEPC